jgi:hypothetical protein
MLLAWQLSRQVLPSYSNNSKGTHVVSVRHRIPPARYNVSRAAVPVKTMCVPFEFPPLNFPEMVDVTFYCSQFSPRHIERRPPASLPAQSHLA